MSFQGSSKTGSINGEYLTKVSGAFYGDALEWTQLEAQLYRHWKSVWIERERKRIRQTWFDYRHVHPVLRSHYFVHEYVMAYRRAYKRFYDAKANTTGMWPWKKGRNLYSKAPGAITQIITTMHVVDELCIPYDVFFDGAIDHMMQKREFSTVWTKARGLEGMKLPPIHVLKDGQALTAAQAMFERRNMTKLRLAAHPHYRAENWHGLADQRDYAKWLIIQARLRGDDMPYALMALVYMRGHLHEREVAREYGVDMVRKIRAIRDCESSQR